MPPEGLQPIKLFYAYAHEDESLHNELAKHLVLLQRQGFIDSWYDRRGRLGPDAVIAGLEDLYLGGLGAPSARRRRRSVR